MTYDPQAEKPTEAFFEEDEGLTLRDYWNILLKRIWLVVLVLVLAVTAMALYTFRQPRIYQARATLIIEPATSSILHELDASSQSGASWFLEGPLFETQLKIIQSRHVADRVVQELGLAENLEFLGLQDIEDEQALAAALENADPAKRLLSLLEVETIPETRMLAIKVRHPNPELAALLTNGIAESYKEQNLEHRSQSMQKAFRWLEDQYDKYEQALEKSRSDLHRFIKAEKENNNPFLFTNPNQQQELTSVLLGDLNKQVIALEGERKRTGHRLSQLRSFEVDFVNTGSLSSFIGSETLTQATNRYIELKQQENVLKRTYLDEHPKVRTVREQIRFLERVISSEISSSKELTRQAHNALKRDETSLREQITKVEGYAFRLEKLKLLYEQFEDRKAEQERLFELVQRRMNEVNLSRLLDSNNVRILDRAQPPTSPVSPRPVLNIAIGLGLGLLLGVMLALLLEWFDDTVKTQEDIERIMPFLGVLPTIDGEDKLRRNPDVPEDAEYRRDLHVQFYPRSSAAECMRTIRTNLLFMTPGQSLKTLLVTSPSPLEGKTTSALSLATVMAQSNSRVLIVDLDLRRPRMHKALGIVPTKGVADVLINDATLDETIHSTVINGLDFLPCGSIPPNPSELLHTDAFKALLKELEGRYDRVVLDSPPVIAVADAMVIAQNVDGLIVVCRSHKTRKELLSRAHQLLQGINAPLLGVILNNLDLRNRRQGTYYYYYRHYGQYYELPDEHEGI